MNFDRFFCTILSDKDMENLGFSDINKNEWFFSKALNNSISFNAFIDKNTSICKIEVLDDDFLQIYDFRDILQHNPGFEYAVEIQNKIVDIMKYFLKNGVVDEETFKFYLEIECPTYENVEYSFKEKTFYLENDDLYVVLFISRNKDNENVMNFKQRSKSFLATGKQKYNLIHMFDEFVKRGVKGEKCRLYISLNPRDQDLIQKKLSCYLIMNNNIDLTKIESKIASIASESDCASTKQWLFDYDNFAEDSHKEKERKFFKFIEEIKEQSECEISYKSTPNGYAVISEHGFDTRKLLNDWNNVELKKDGMLYIASYVNAEF